MQIVTHLLRVATRAFSLFTSFRLLKLGCPTSVLSYMLLVFSLRSLAVTTFTVAVQPFMCSDLHSDLFYFVLAVHTFHTELFLPRYITTHSPL
jgi:hypothetical protein